MTVAGPVPGNSILLSHAGATHGDAGHGGPPRPREKRQNLCSGSGLSDAIVREGTTLVSLFGMHPSALGNAGGFTVRGSQMSCQKVRLQEHRSSYALL